MHHDQSRRRALAQLSAASLAALSPWALAQKPISLGFIYVGPKDDFGYNQAHAEAVAEVKKMAGIKAVADEVLPDTLYLMPLPHRPFFPGQVQPVGRISASRTISASAM